MKYYVCFAALIAAALLAGATARAAIAGSDEIIANTDLPDDYDGVICGDVYGAVYVMGSLGEQETPAPPTLRGRRGRKQEAVSAAEIFRYTKSSSGSWSEKKTELDVDQDEVLTQACATINDALYVIVGVRDKDGDQNSKIVKFMIEADGALTRANDTTELDGDQYKYLVARGDRVVAVRDGGTTADSKVGKVFKASDLSDIDDLDLGDSAIGTNSDIRTVALDSNGSVVIATSAGVTLFVNDADSYVDTFLDDYTDINSCASGDDNLFYCATSAVLYSIDVADEKYTTDDYDFDTSDDVSGNVMADGAGDIVLIAAGTATSGSPLIYANSVSVLDKGSFKFDTFEDQTAEVSNVRPRSYCVALAGTDIAYITMDVDEAEVVAFYSGATAYATPAPPTPVPTTTTTTTAAPPAGAASVAAAVVIAAVSALLML